ncbi:MAG: hypothetical protein DRO39_01910 [Thermoprotei archaeon]|nr:MAG: hypothetical protein DRO39_01910 [Thermoprotei archaeon]
MPRIVEPRLIRVPAHAYRAVRSFMESSLRDDYPWNVGVVMDNVAIFSKPRKWILKTWRDAEGEHWLLENSNQEILHIKGSAVYINGNVNDQPLDINSPELHVYFIVPDAEVPFAHPISLRDVVEKMLKYPLP